MPTSKQIYKRLIMEQQPTKMWTTEIWAIDNKIAVRSTAVWNVKKWQGPHVPGTTIEDAQRYCDTHSLGYCRVVGELIAEGEMDTILDYNN